MELIVRTKQIGASRKTRPDTKSGAGRKNYRAMTRGIPLMS